MVEEGRLEELNARTICLMLRLLGDVVGTWTVLG